MRLLVFLNKTIYILILLVFITGCHHYYGMNASEKLPSDSNITCKKYLQSIPIFWQGKEGEYYEFAPDSPSFYGRFVQNTNVCFQGFSSEQIKQYLGTPNVEGATELIYYVSKACLTRDRDCNVQIFKIADGFFKETLLIMPKRYKG